MVLSDSERTLDILFAVLELRISDICNSSILGCVSGDCVIIFLLSVKETNAPHNRVAVSPSAAPARERDGIGREGAGLGDQRQDKGSG